ncbi:MAG: isoprenyl transferase [Lachnospiraceae bacterium]|nr:isoprenyl transferase [Lachnospiraceae bacterium]
MAFGKKEVTQSTVVPKHVAIIMDGNGRWAKKRFLPRNAGHAQGSRVAEQICEDAWNLGIEYLTIYAFSTENWSRPKDEVDALMKLLRKYMKDSIARSSKNNMRVHVIGDISALDEDLQESIRKLEEVSSVNTGLKFQVAINYGGRDEILRAARAFAKECADGTKMPEQLDEALFYSYFDTAGIPYPDLMIRTSGEMRTSNFLPWQLAYTEFYFTDVLWPDFNKKELQKAIEYYAGRDRRFGGVTE